MDGGESREQDGRRQEIIANMVPGLAGSRFTRFSVVTRHFLPASVCRSFTRFTYSIHTRRRRRNEVTTGSK